MFDYPKHSKVRRTNEDGYSYGIVRDYDTRFSEYKIYIVNSPVVAHWHLFTVSLISKIEEYLYF